MKKRERVSGFMAKSFKHRRKILFLFVMLFVIPQAVIGWNRPLYIGALTFLIFIGGALLGAVYLAIAIMEAIMRRAVVEYDLHPDLVEMDFIEYFFRDNREDDQ